VHDPHALQAPHPVVEVLAHAADLTVEALRQHDTERIASDLGDTARIGHRLEDRYAAGHARQELMRQRPVDRDDVFLLVLVLGTEHAIDDVAVVGQQDQAF
jgi:hypothetical protein